jgi:hypothetical protein
MAEAASAAATIPNNSENTTTTNVTPLSVIQLEACNYAFSMPASQVDQFYLWPMLLYNTSIMHPNSNAVDYAFEALRNQLESEVDAYCEANKIPLLTPEEKAVFWREWGNDASPVSAKTAITSYAQTDAYKAIAKAVKELL